MNLKLTDCEKIQFDLSDANRGLWKTTPLKNVRRNIVPIEEDIGNNIPMLPIEKEESFLEKLSVKLLPHQIHAVRWIKAVETMYPGKGGILADDMGLGKTLTCCALIYHTFYTGLSKPQLIVCPKSVVTHWESELKLCGVRNIILLSSKTRESVRAAGLLDNGEAQVLITSFEMLTKTDHGNDVVNTKWGRIIVDEAHIIKNPKSKAYKLIKKLKAANKWMVTGTPMMNHIQDVAVLSKIVTPDEPLTFEDASKERSWKKRFFLRRTKDECDLNIKRKVESEWLDLLEHHKAGYREIELAAVNRFENRNNQGKTNLLTYLGRLRQYCTHPLLLQGSAYTATLAARARACKSSSKKRKAFQLEDDEDEDLSSKFPDLKEVEHSAKTLRMMEIIASYDSSTKFVVFSQWVSALDVCEVLLRRENIGCLRFDGSIHESSGRAEVIRKFHDVENRVILVSLKAGGVGVNLTAANVVICLDLWWNYFSENQAFDRVARIGQPKPVTVHRLFLKDTVEAEVLDVQSKKNQMNHVFMTDKVATKRELSLSELHSVFKSLRKRASVDGNYGLKIAPTRGSLGNLFPKMVERSNINEMLDKTSNPNEVQ